MDNMRVDNTVKVKLKKKTVETVIVFYFFFFFCRDSEYRYVNFTTFACSVYDKSADLPRGGPFCRTDFLDSRQYFSTTHDGVHNGFMIFDF